MSAAAVLAVIVAAGEAHTPLTDALVGAAAEAVGAAATVKVAEIGSHSDRAVLRVEASLDALAAVSLVWDDDQHLRAHTRLHVVRSDRWIDRAIGFEPADKLSERGRALGFTIASMLPEAGADIEVTLPESFAVREPTPNHALQVDVVGTGGPGSSADLGGSVAGERLIRESVALRVGLDFHQGRLDGTSFGGTKTGLGLAAGAVWWLLAPGPGARPGFGLRADLVGQQLKIAQDGSLATKVAYVFGADVVAEGTLRVAAGVEVVLGLGAQALVQGVDILYDPNSNPRYTIGSVRAVAEGGMRFLF